MKRRKFIRQGMAGTTLLSAFPYHLLAGTEKLYPYDRVSLGNTGITMSRMAMGTGTGGYGGSSNQTRKLGIKGLPDLLRAAFDEGKYPASKLTTRPIAKAANISQRGMANSSTTSTPSLSIYDLAINDASLDIPQPKIIPTIAPRAPMTADSTRNKSLI